MRSETRSCVRGDRGRHAAIASAASDPGGPLCASLRRSPRRSTLTSPEGRASPSSLGLTIAEVPTIGPMPVHVALVNRKGPTVAALARLNADALGRGRALARALGLPFFSPRPRPQTLKTLRSVAVVLWIDRSGFKVPDSWAPEIGSRGWVTPVQRSVAKASRHSVGTVSPLPSTRVFALPVSKPTARRSISAFRAA